MNIFSVEVAVALKSGRDVDVNILSCDSFVSISSILG